MTITVDNGAMAECEATIHGDRRARLTRRATLRLMVLGTSAALLAACAPPPSAPSPLANPAAPTPAAASAVSTTAPASAASAQAKTGGSLIFGMVGDLPSMDGHLSNAGLHNTLAHVFDKLTEYDPATMKVHGLLVETWDITADYTQIKLNLRKGVQWHTGREFTSDDVKWNLLRVRDPKVGAAQWVNQSNWYSTIDTPDKYTVVLKGDSPRLGTFDFFQTFNILDRSTMEGPDAQTRAVGTGPFTFVEWAQGDHWLYARNPNYWQAGVPLLDGLRVNIFRDPTSMVTQLESGALDVANSPPLQDFARLKADSANFQTLVHSRGSRFYTIGANVLTPAIADKRVRQALNYAVDRQRFVDTILLGFSKPLSLFWTSTSLAYEPQKEVQFDLDKARSLLKDAGVSSVEVDMTTFPFYPETDDFNLMYQADLAKIGINYNIKSLDPAAAFPLIHDARYAGLYQADGGVLNEPSYLFLQNLSLNPTQNNSNFQDPNYKQLIDAALSEPDDAKRKQIYSQLNDILIDQSFCFTTATVPIRIGTRARVRGIAENAHDSFNFKTASLDGGSAGA